MRQFRPRGWLWLCPRRGGHFLPLCWLSPAPSPQPGELARFWETPLSSSDTGVGCAHDSILTKEIRVCQRLPLWDTKRNIPDGMPWATAVTHRLWGSRAEGDFIGTTERQEEAGTLTVTLSNWVTGWPGTATSPQLVFVYAGSQIVWVRCSFPFLLQRESQGLDSHFRMWQF